MSAYNNNRESKWWENLMVELAVFVDETLWLSFRSKHSDYATAYSQLRDYVTTVMNNVRLYDIFMSFLV